jgi:DNA-binding NarL/FixJ family response regulator
MATRVLLVDDHQIIRDGIKSVLDREPDIEVVGESETSRAAIALAAELVPDVVVMDIAMPDLTGIEATRQILKENPEIHVVALSMHTDKRYILAMLQAGACAYLVKSSAVQELVEAIGAVREKKKYLSPSISQTVIEELTKETLSEELTVYNKLTAREREVLQLLAEGNATRQVAGKLHISTSTVETHRRQLMEKLNLFSVAELTKYAIREGLTTVDE